MSEICAHEWLIIKKDYLLEVDIKADIPAHQVVAIRQEAKDCSVYSEYLYHECKKCGTKIIKNLTKEENT